MGDDIWKNIPNYKKYECNIYGIIRNKNTKKTTSINENKSGYSLAALTADDGKRSIKRIDILILSTFKNNDDNYTDIIHINNIANDNNVNNLKFVSKEKLKEFKNNLVNEKIIENNKIIKNNEDEEYWQVIPDFTNYEISSLGRVRNHITEKILSISTDYENYTRVTLLNDTHNKYFSKLIHQLVAITYIPNPEKKPTVNHKNKIRNDNRLKNLEWATMAEQNTDKTNNSGNSGIRNKRGVIKCDLEENIIKKYDTIEEAATKNNISISYIKSCIYKKKNQSKFIWKYEETTDLKDENWIEIDPAYINNYEGYFVSNLWRIKNKYGYIHKIRIHNGYYKVSIGDKDYVIHRIMAKVYLPNPTDLPVVNHIDGNKLNNNIENLEWTTYKDNCIHAVENNLTLGRRKILQYDLEGKFIKIFNSISEAHKLYNTTNITDTLSKNSKKLENARYYTCKNFIWIYHTELILKNLTINEPISVKCKKINKVDLNDNIIASYDSITEASKKNNMTNVSYYIKNNIYKDGYTYKFG